MLLDVTATFKAIGQSEPVRTLTTNAMDCVIEFLGLSLSSECPAEAEEALAVDVME
jgi:dihydroxyacid dehydratase/phosphogluconate dehydratase